jgi:hypothetical protein
MPRRDSADKPSAQPRRRIDLAIGVVLGLVLGIVIVSAFVFLGSEGSVDAPRISGVSTGKPMVRYAPPANAKRAEEGRASQGRR